MSTPLTLISSMATRHLLAALAQAWRAEGGAEVQIESLGGVDAARRVQDGAAFDLVVLAADAMDKLAAAGRLLAGSLRPVVDSTVAIAVPAVAAELPDVASVPALQASLLRARRIGYSTGPSGAALLRLIDAWGLTDALRDRLRQTPPGVPVGQWLAQGEVDIGFQQRSELLGLPGITLLGDMPPGATLLSRFSGAVVQGSAQAVAARAALDFFASPATDALKRAHGMHGLS